MKLLKKILILIVVIVNALTLGSCKKETYNVNFLVGEDVVSTSVVEENAKVILPSAPTKDYYSFDGWFDAEGNAITNDTVITSELNAFAKWTVNKYTITFDSNGGSSVKDLVAGYNENISVPQDPTRTGYTFLGWFLDEEEYFFDKMPGNDLSLKAKWSQKEVTITFNSDGGTKIPQYIYLPGTAITAPKNPSKKGCEFLGWYFNDVLFTFDVMPNENTTLVAKWQDTVYNITYELDGGDGSNLVKTYSSARTGEIDLVRPTKDGYAFLGFYTNSTFTSAPIITIPLNINRNLTLYARFVPTKLSSTKSVAIYGDSISTYEGYVPSDALFYYPLYSQTVKNVEKTWWRLFQAQTGVDLLKNISYSGSTVCGSDSTCGMSGARIKKMTSSNGETPDIIILYLGINDAASATSETVFKTCYQTMLDRMKSAYPDVDIFMCNLPYETWTDGTNPEGKSYPGLREKYNVVIKELATANNLPMIDLDKVITKDTEKVNDWHYLGDNIHPSDIGMVKIADAVSKAVEEFYK